MRTVRLLGIPTDGDAVMLDDTLVTVCPWWDGPIARQRLHRQLERDAAKPKRSWIWVYHAPPEGSPTAWTGKRSYGDAALTAWIAAYRPDIVLTGHIHEAPFESAGSWVDRIGDTWIFNCGRQIGPVPSHIVIDTDVGEAAWFSIEGAELVRLAAPFERRTLTAAPSWLNLNTQAPGPSPP
jgi:hypothetical protein